jgi:RNA polymerase sigma-70 factor (ECF subfamily)
MTPTGTRVVASPLSAAALYAQIAPHLGELRRYALRLSRQPADADDLVQDLLVKLLSRGAPVAHLDSPRAWLQRSLYHLFVDTRRRERLIDSRSMDAGDAESEWVLAQLEAEAVQAPGLESGLLRSEDQQQMDALLERLPPVQQQMLRLHLEQDIGISEIAVTLGIPRETVKSNLARARTRLRAEATATAVVPVSRGFRRRRARVPARQRQA